MLCVCLLEARVPLFVVSFCQCTRGVVVFLCTGGKFVFVRVLTFRRNFCVEKWRGLRYGNFYVGGTNLGTLCVASMSLSSTGNVCLRAI